MAMIVENLDVGKLSERGILVRLNLSLWDRFVADKAGTEVLASRFDTNRGRARKELVPEVKKIWNLGQQIRMAHYKMTLPWDDRDWRLLPVAMMETYGDTLRNWEKQMDEIVEDICSRWEELKIADKAELKGMYNEADYPDSDEIKRRCQIRVGYQPIPSHDFRTELDASLVEAIRAEIKFGVEERFTQASADLMARLVEALEHVAEILGKEKTKIHRSLLTSMKDLVDLVPKLNITDDMVIRNMSTKIRALFTGLSAEALKEDPVERQRVVTEAKAIVAEATKAKGAVEAPKSDVPHEETARERMARQAAYLDEL